MTKNTRQHAAKKTVAKKAGKADRLKLRKRAQTEDVTARLDKDLELVCSIKQREPIVQTSKSLPQAGSDIEALLRRL